MDMKAMTRASACSQGTGFWDFLVLFGDLIRLDWKTGHNLLMVYAVRGPGLIDRFDLIWIWISSIPNQNSSTIFSADGLRSSPSQPITSRVSSAVSAVAGAATSDLVRPWDSLHPTEG